MDEVAEIILTAISPHVIPAELNKLRKRTKELLAGFPLYLHL